MDTRRLAVALALLALTASTTAQVVLEPPVSSTANSHAQRVLLGDMNEDGFPDALVGHAFSGPPPVMALGLGDGTFGPPQPLPVGAAQPKRLGDFDEDGHLDLLVGGVFLSPGNLGVLLGDGRGGFSGLTSIHAGEAFDIDAGDFNGDGHLDVAIINEPTFGFENGNVMVALGNGDGGFAKPDQVDVTGSVLSHFTSYLRVGDSNGDGFDDIVYKVAGAAVVRLNQGDGDFAPAPCSGCAAITEHDIVLIDLNGDGREDALTPSRIVWAQADGSFGAAVALGAGPGPVTVATGHLDGDGLLDLVVGCNGSGFLFDTAAVGSVHVLRGLGGGSFAASSPVVSPVPSPRGLAIADLDGDGRSDVAVAEMLESPVTLDVLLNHTYDPGSPFLDLGGALAGTHGHPIQLASGTLVTGQPFSFKLANGPPNGAAYHIVGVSQLAAPFKGGTLIPFPSFINGPLPLDASGGLNLAALWPAGGSGLTLWLQFWMPNGGGPAGFVASSGVRAQVP